MGNSLQIIKKHYRSVVSKNATAEFWKITPTYDGRSETIRQPSAAEISQRRGKRLAEMMAEV